MCVLGSKHYNSAKHNIKTISSLSTQKTNTTIHQQTKPPLLLSPTSPTYPTTHAPTLHKLQSKTTTTTTKEVQKHTKLISWFITQNTYLCKMCADAHQTKPLLPFLHPPNWSLNAKNKTTTTKNNNPTLFCPWKLNIISRYICLLIYLYVVGGLFLFKILGPWLLVEWAWVKLGLSLAYSMAIFSK